MKKLFLNSIMMVLALAIIFTACKKDKKDSTTTADDTPQQSTAGSDESRFSEETDLVLNYADSLVAGSNIAGARVAFFNVCGATVIDSIASKKKLTLNFDGSTSCVNNTRKRSGQVSIQLTNKPLWNDTGAVLTITFNNYKVTRNSDNKSITINGTKTVTNVNGGLVKNVLNGTLTSVSRIIQGTGLTVTFDDGTVRTWNTNRKRVITKDGDGNTIITVTGNNGVDGYFNVAVWGTNRYGVPFYTTIETPVVLSSCNALGEWTAVSGVKIHKALVREITVTFGVNQDGTNNGTCLAYGFKVDWTNLKNESKEAVVSY